MEGRKKRKIKPTKKYLDCEDQDADLGFLTKRSSSLLEISIDVNSRSRKRRKSSCSSVVTIHLTENLASQWNQLKEELTVSNEELLEYLLKIRYEYFSSDEIHTVDLSESENRTEKGKTIENIPEIQAEMSEDVPSNRDNVKIDADEMNEAIAVESHNEETYEEQREDRKKYKSVQTARTSAKSKVCNICQKVLRSGTDRRIHIMSEHFTLYTECIYCLQMKKNQNGTNGKNTHVEIQEYFNHLESVHEGKKLECPFCKASNSQSAFCLRKHMVAKHRAKLSCRCNVCHPKDTRSNQKVLIKAVSLKRHLRIRHPPDEIAMGLKKSCEECGIIVMSHNMARHILNAHSEKNNNASNLCEICGKHFAKLKQHNLSVHKAKEEWHFQCTQCNKRFAKRYNLQVHERLHTGERPYVCDICGKSFCQFIELRLHSKKHLPGSKRNTNKMKTNENKSMVNQQQKLLPGREIILQTTPVMFQSVQLRSGMLEGYHTPTSVCSISNEMLKNQDQVLRLSSEKEPIHASQTMYAVLTELSEPVEITTTSASVSEQLDSSFMQSLSAVLNMNADTNPLRTESEEKFHGVPVSDVKWAENTVKDFSP